MKTIDLLDQCKEKLGITQDSELAIAIGAKKTAISNYRTGIRKPDVEACFKIAEILNIEPSRVITAIKLEGSTTPEERTFWQRHAKRYGVASVTPFLLVGILTAMGLLAPVPASGSAGFDTYYVLCAIALVIVAVEQGLSKPIFTGLRYGYAKVCNTLGRLDMVRRFIPS